MTCIYLIERVSLVEGYDGRDHEERDFIDEVWFASEEDAKTYMRENALKTRDELAAEASAAADREFAVSTRKHTRDAAAYAQALASGVEARMLHEPRAPYRHQKRVDSWSEIITVTQYTPPKGK